MFNLTSLPSTVLFFFPIIRPLHYILKANIVIFTPLDLFDIVTNYLQITDYRLHAASEPNLIFKLIYFIRLFTL